MKYKYDYRVDFVYRTIYTISFFQKLKLVYKILFNKSVVQNIRGIIYKDFINKIEKVK